MKKIMVATAYHTITQKDLGEKLGVPKHRIVDIENGKSKPNFEELEEICKIIPSLLFSVAASHLMANVLASKFGLVSSDLFFSASSSLITKRTKF